MVQLNGGLDHTQPCPRTPRRSASDALEAHGAGVPEHRLGVLALHVLATIDHIARVIREADYIPTTKRGSGAAEMTAQEAVNLLLAANGADTPSDGPAAIDRFRSLRLETYRPADTAVATFKAITEAENFGRALEILIDGMPEVLRIAFDFVERCYPQKAEVLKGTLLKHTWDLAPFNVSVQLKRYSTEIVCRSWAEMSGAAQTEFAAQFQVDYDLLTEGFYGRLPGRKISVEFGGETLLKLSTALRTDSAAKEVL